MISDEEVDKLDQQFEQFKNGGMKNPPHGTLDSGKRQVAPTQGTLETPQSVPYSDTSGVGATIGSIAGFLATKGRGAMAQEGTSAGGAIVGDLAETAIRQAIDPTREVTAGRMIKSALKEGGASLAGGGLVRGGFKLYDLAVDKGRQILSSAFVKTMTAEGKAITNFIDGEAKRLGIKYDKPMLTAAELTESPVVDTIDNAAKASLGGAGIYRRYQLERQKVYTEIGEDIANSFGGRQADPGVIADVFVEVAKENPKILEAPAKVLRNTVEAAAGQANWQAPVGVIRENAKDILGIIKRTGNIAAKEQGKPVASGLEKATKPESIVPEELLVVGSKGEKLHKAVIDDEEVVGSLALIQQEIANLPNTKAVTDLINIRQALFEYTKKISRTFELQGSTLDRNLKTQIKHLNNAIEDGLSQSGVPPVFKKMWRDQNDIFRETRALYKDPVSISLIKGAEKNPAGVVNAVFKMRDQNGLRLIKRTKELILPKELHRQVAEQGLPARVIDKRTAAWKGFQAEAMTTLFHNAIDQDLGTWSGKKLIEQINTFERPVLDEMFGRQVTSRLIKFAEYMKHIQSKNPVSTGGMAVQLTQMGAILAVARGKLPIEAGIVVLAPRKAANIMTTNEGLDMLERGTKMTPSDPRWTSLMGKLLAMSEVKYLEEKEYTSPSPRTVSSNISLARSLIDGPAYIQ